jgi:hypothetical protein
MAAFVEQCRDPRPHVCRIGALSPIRLNAALKCRGCLNSYAPHIARDFECRALTAAAISRSPVDPR